MARYHGPKQRISRRYREPLFGFSKAVERKQYAPGQHGKNKRPGKQSEYAVQLMMKQKAKFIYGVLERQFRLIFERASHARGATGEILLQLLEARLDNTVYRLGFSPTRRGARQIVNHNHILVNGSSVNIPSYTLKPGDVIEVRERSKALEAINVANKRSQRGSRYPWLEVDRNELSGKFLHFPERKDIPENIEERLIVELYSR